MKIEQHENNSTGNVFTFPHNANVYEDKTEKNMQRQKSATHWDYFTLGDAQLKSKRNLVIRGHFDGPNRNSNFRELHKEMHDNSIKRFFFSDDKFMIVIPQGVERTHDGQRTNFVDYVGNIISPFNVLFEDPVKSTDATNTQTNQGNMPSPLIEITISATSGNTYRMQDSQNNGLEFDASETGDYTIKLISMIEIGGGIYQTWYYDVRAPSGNSVFPAWANANKSLFLRLQEGEQISTISARENPSGANTDISSSVTIKWTSAYSSD